MRTAIIRYAPRAVGVNPSASQGEARLRGLWRIISSKTISPRLNPPTPRVRGAWGEARLRGRERNNDSKTMFLTRWKPFASLHRLGARASRPHAWERGHPAPPGSAGVSPACREREHLASPGSAGVSPACLGARASCPTWERGRLARMPGTRASRPAWERGHPALQGQVLGRRLRSLSRFGLQDAQTPPSPRVGAGAWGMRGTSARE